MLDKIKRGAFIKWSFLFLILIFPLSLLNVRNVDADENKGCCVDYIVIDDKQPCVNGQHAVTYKCIDWTKDPNKIVDDVPCSIQNFPGTPDNTWTGMESCGGGGAAQGRVVGRISTSDLRFFTKAGTNCDASDIQSNNIKVSSKGIESSWECNQNVEPNRLAPFYKITSSLGKNTFTLTPPETFACDRWTVGYPTDSTKNAAGMGCSATIDVLEGDWNTHLWFYVTPISAPGGDDAIIISDTIPANMLVGVIYDVSVTVKNTGTSTWTSAEAYNLGAVDDSDALAINLANGNRVNLPKSVAPNEIVTFNFQMKTPREGNFVTDWRMVHDGVRWFGAALVKNVNVIPKKGALDGWLVWDKNGNGVWDYNDSIIKNAPSILTINNQMLPFCAQYHPSVSNPNFTYTGEMFVLSGRTDCSVPGIPNVDVTPTGKHQIVVTAPLGFIPENAFYGDQSLFRGNPNAPSNQKAGYASRNSIIVDNVDISAEKTTHINFLFRKIPSCSKFSISVTSKISPIWLIPGDEITIRYRCEADFADIYVSKKSNFLAGNPNWKFVGGSEPIGAIKWSTELMSGGDYVIGIIPYDMKWWQAYQPGDPNYENRGKIGSACFPTKDGGILGGEVSGSCTTQFRNLTFSFPECEQLSLDRDSLISGEAVNISYFSLAQFTDIWLANLSSWNADAPNKWKKFIGGSKPSGSVLWSTANVAPGIYVVGGISFNKKWWAAYQPNSSDYPNRGKVGNACFPTKNGGILGGEISGSCNKQCFKQIEIRQPIQIVNNPPVLAPIGNKQVNENELLQFTISATDPDNDILTYSASNLPAGAVFNPQTRTFSWTPNYVQAGSYQVTFTVSDSSLTDSETITITVNNVNRAPVISSYSPLTNPTIAEGSSQVFSVTASDPDNDALTITWYLDNNQIATGNSFTYSPDYNSAGNHNVKVIVSDSSLAAEKEWTAIVTNTNRAPILAGIGNKQTTENQLLSFTISATDPDSDALTFSTSALPAGAMFNILTGTFSWTPSYEQAGSYQVTFTVSDGSLTDSETITITVNNINRAPIIDSRSPLTNPTVAESSSQAFSITASDPDNNALTITWFLDNAQIATGNSFTYSPDYASAGMHNVKVVVSDGFLTAEGIWIVTVTNTNRPPVLAPIGNKQVNENQLLTFTVSATDPDGDALTFMSFVTSFGASFNGLTQTFSWTPNYEQSGSYQVPFTVSDGLLTDSETVTITVNNINRAPALSGSVTPASGDITTLFTYTATYSDVDNNAPAFVRVYTDGNANTMQQTNPADNNYIDGAEFSFSTRLSRAQHNFYFEANDGTVTVATSVVNLPSVLNSAPRIISSPVTVLQESDPYDFESVYSYDVEAVDLENDVITYSLDVRPDGMSINPLTGLIVWKPNRNQLGVSNVVVRASDSYSFTTQAFSVNVILPSSINIPRREIYISKFSPLEEKIKSGDVLPVAVGIKNIGLYHLEETSIILIIPDLGVRKKIGPFKLKAREEFSTIIYLEIPEEAEPGVYDLRLSVNDVGLLRERYREFKIIN